MRLRERGVTSAGYAVEQQWGPGVKRVPTFHMSSAQAETISGKDAKAGLGTALTASAELMRVDDAAQAQALYLKRQNWQERVWLYYDEIPEVHYAGQYVSRAIGKIRLVAARTDKLSEDHSPTMIADGVGGVDGDVSAAVAKLKSSKGGQAMFLRNLSLNLFGPGETMLLGQTKRGGKQDWSALSIDELRIIPGTLAQRFRFPGSVPEDIPRTDFVIRLWMPHPRFSSLADSALAACIDQCEQLLLLTKAEKAAARSRFAGSGLLFIPLELVPPAWQNQNRHQDPAQSNPLIQQLTEAMMEPLRDESHPSSVIPLLLFGPAEYGEKIKFFTFERPIDKQMASMKQDAISRLAAGIDMPSEVVDGGGLGRTNHWSSLQIMESVFTAHIQPVIEAICDSLTTGYLVPALRKAGLKGDDPEKYCIWYDATALIAKADQSETAQQLHDRIVISDAALRRANNFPETDSPDKDEYAKRVGLKLLQPHTALTGEEPPAPPAGAPGIPGGSGPATGAPGGAPAGPGRPNVRAGQAPSTPGGPSAGPPRQASERRVTGPASQGPVPGVAKHPQLMPPTRLRSALTSAGYGDNPSVAVSLARLDQQLLRDLRVEGDIAVGDALRRAGERLAQATGVGTAYVTSVGPEAVLVAAGAREHAARVGVGPEDLVPDDFDASEAKVLHWLTSGVQEALDYLRGWLAARSQAEGFGIEAYTPTMEENCRIAARMWRDNLLALVRNRLFLPWQDAPARGESDALKVHPDLARKVLLRAGGGSVAPADAPLAGGLATGQTLRDMAEAAGAGQRGWVWVYGEDRRSFQGHLQLDGATFDAWTDPVLHVWPEDYWLHRAHYSPGDHRGCQCFVGPNLD